MITKPAQNQSESTGNIFFDKSISDILEGFKSKTIDPLEVAQTCIEQIQKYDSVYKAWVCFDRELLLRKAKEVKIRIDYGENIRPLEGIPVGVKDIFNTNDFPTQMGSPLWNNFTPGNDARVIYYIKQAGGIIPGKTVTAEFAVHSLLEKTLNPHDISLTPGTSSSGSAVAIALGMVPLALGTQTGGSIIRPSSFCGVYGCKPSFGLIPRTGVLKTNDSLDTIGFFASRFANIERTFQTLRIHGPNYPVSYKALSDPSIQNKPADRPWHIALIKTHTWHNAPDYAKSALINWTGVLGKDKQIEITEPDLPQIMRKAHEVHTLIYDKSLSYYFQREFTSNNLISPMMNEIIERGNRISTEEYQKALAAQQNMIREMNTFLSNYDALISLSTAGEAPLRTEQEKPDPALMWTMTHLPVISAPVFVSPKGLPFGVQFASRKYNDLLLFRFLSYLRSLDYIPEGPNPLLIKQEAFRNLCSGDERKLS
jgi:Asp-tRNA(Asn)/Glu-tRNA(Gln) amidotransferase A subunit family amidase